MVDLWVFFNIVLTMMRPYLIVFLLSLVLSAEVQTLLEKARRRSAA